MFKDCADCKNVGRRGGCPNCRRKRAYFPETATPQERFWGRVRKTEGCWFWEGALTSHGYGEFVYKGVNWRAHKLAWFLTYGTVPDGLKSMAAVLMHSCDNKRCVNVKHLKADTQGENMRDMLRKGRKRSAKLVPAQVIVIRSRHRAGESIADLAKDYGVGKHVVQHITAGRTWRAIV